MHTAVFRRNPRTHALLLVTGLLLTAACQQDAPAPAAGDAPKKDGAAPAAAPAPSIDGKWEKTASGLEYQVLRPGKGTLHPKMRDSVSCDYKGWLENGKEFDSSYKRGQPATFDVGGVIDGWNEALVMMTEGAKWRLRIPSPLGYGPSGSPPDIPPNATLYFEIELHGITPYKEPPPMPGMPVFTKPDPAAQKTTASGLKYEVLKEGEGTPPGEDTPMELKFTFFNASGKLMDCTEKSGTIKARPKDMNLPFLKEGPQMMKPGARYRFEVPPALGFGATSRGPDLPANSTMYWELELVRVMVALAAPPFEAVDESKFEKRPSGLLVQQVKAGEGTSPKLGQNVTVHYAGWLTDGTIFDSSYPRGEPATFRLGEVIEGWNEGVQLMKPGAVYKFVIPAALAYGDRPMGDIIKPGSTLVFQVELISVEK